MASRGFVVASISANGFAQADNASFWFALSGQLGRARLIQKHIELLLDANEQSVAQIEDKLVGKINRDKIGLLGHSRGAEAVLINTIINNGDGKRQFPAAPNPELFGGAQNDEAQFKIGAVMSVQPTKAFTLEVNDTPMALVLGYADGDVDLDGAAHFESSLYSSLYGGRKADLAPKHLIYAMGANHNYFNTLWIPGYFPAGTFDDTDNRVQGCFLNPNHAYTGRYTPVEQLQMLNAYATGFFELYLNDNQVHKDVLTGRQADPFASTLLTPTDVSVVYHGPDQINNRFDINRIDFAQDAVYSSSLGSDILYDNVSNVRFGAGPNFQAQVDLNSNHPFLLDINQDLSQVNFQTIKLEPHSRGNSVYGIGAVRAKANDDQSAIITHQINGDADISAYNSLQFRLAIPFEQYISSDQDSLDICQARHQNSLQESANRFTASNNTKTYHSSIDVFLELTDNIGNVQAININQYSPASSLAPGLPNNSRLIFNQANVPLNAFKNIDLTAVTDISIKFEAGADIAISDLALVN